MSQITAKIIADSITPTGERLTSLELQYPRWILAELNTHRTFSRSSVSSRAVPIRRMISQVWNDPAIPVKWGSNQSGMQAGEELEGWRLHAAKLSWTLEGKTACMFAAFNSWIGLHKELANRGLEKRQLTRTIVTATDWKNFFILRDHPNAQPEIQVLARVMKEVMGNSEPTLLEVGDFHLPYVRPEEIKRYKETDNEWLLPVLSSARCARVSYNRHDGSTSSVKEDKRLFERLVISEPAHCFDSKTEVLTGRGFVPWPEVSEEDTFACVDHRTGKFIGLHPANELIKKDYEGYFYSYEGPDISCRVTANHRLYAHQIKRHTDRTATFSPSLLPANTPNSEKAKYPTVGESELRMATSAFPFEVERGQDFHLGQLAGFFVGDGSAAEDCRNVITFNLRRQDKIDYLRTLAYNLGYEFRQNSSCVLEWPDIAKLFRSQFYTQTGEKTFPDHFFDSPPEFVAGFFDGLRNSDGSERRRTWVYSTSSKTLSEKLIALGACFGVSFTPTVTSYGGGRKDIVTLNASNPEVRVNDSRKPYSRVNKEWGSEKVYCASVPGEVLITRRNGKVLLSGNSSPAEHQAQYVPHLTSSRNFRGPWYQFRAILEHSGWGPYSSTGVTVEL